MMGGHPDVDHRRADRPRVGPCIAATSSASAGLPGQQTVRGTLDTIAERSRSAGIRPAIT
jgi:hypothetical protein